MDAKKMPEKFTMEMVKPTMCGATTRVAIGNARMLVPKPNPIMNMVTQSTHHGQSATFVMIHCGGNIKSKM